MRVKIQYKDTRFWFALDLPTATVKDLGHLLCKKINIRQANLTLDGFQLLNDSLVSQVIRENDLIIVEEKINLKRKRGLMKELNEKLNSELIDKKLNGNFNSELIDNDSELIDSESSDNDSNSSDSESSDNQCSDNESSDSESSNSDSHSNSLNIQSKTLSKMELKMESKTSDSEQEEPTKEINVPMSLSSKKRRQANELLEKTPVHLKFTQDEEKEHSPIVKMTRVDLFDIPPQMTKSQKARARKRKRMAARNVEKDGEFKQNSENKPNSESQKDYSVFSSLHQPVQGARIAFKVLEMTFAYTPEISDYKEADIVSIQSNQVTLHLLTQQPLSQGKFDLEPMEQENNVTLDWHHLMDVRLIKYDSC